MMEQKEKTTLYSVVKSSLKLHSVQPKKDKGVGAEFVFKDDVHCYVV